MDKQAATAAIAEKTKQAMALIREAQQIADEHKLTFNFDIAYAMGGTYIGDPTERWNQDYGHTNGWHPSSQGC